VDIGLLTLGDWVADPSTGTRGLSITAGLRSGEVVNLEVGDAYLSSDPPRIRVVGKGDKPRTVTLPPETVAVIRQYLQNRQKRLGKPAPGERLIVRSDGRSCTRSVIDNIVRRWFRRAGRTPPKGALAHSLRHTYATLLIENGASLPEVQRLLGHSDLSTTQAYLGVTGKGLEEAALANPARRLLEPEGLS
jgi:integrase/recombinase XerD